MLPRNLEILIIVFTNLILLCSIILASAIHVHAMEWRFTSRSMRLYNPWPWARPGAYAVYTPIPIQIEENSETPINATLWLKWVITNVTPSGVYVRVYLMVPEINYNESKLFFVAYNGSFYDAKTMKYLGIWTLFRPPQTLIPGSKVLIAVKAPVAAAGPVKATVERLRKPYFFFQLPGLKELDIYGYVLVALKYGLALERFVVVDATTKALKELGNYSVVAEKIAKALIEKYPELKSWKLYNPRLPAVKGWEMWLENLLKAKWFSDLPTACTYDTITGLAISIDIDADIMSSYITLLSDDTLTAIGIPKFAIEYSTMANPEGWPNFFKLFNVSKNEVIKVLHVKGEFSNVSLCGCDSLLLKTNVFSLMREAVVGAGTRGVTTSTSSTTPKPVATHVSTSSVEKLRTTTRSMSVAAKTRRATTSTSSTVRSVTEVKKTVIQSITNTLPKTTSLTSSSRAPTTTTAQRKPTTSHGLTKVSTVSRVSTKSFGVGQRLGKAKPMQILTTSRGRAVRTSIPTKIAARCLSPPSLLPVVITLVLLVSGAIAYAIHRTRGGR